MELVHKQFGIVRAEMDERGEVWFVANDICRALGYSNPRKAIKDHTDEDERRVSQIVTPSGVQKMNMINESGLYALILRSNKPEAKKFRKWVTSEVLPALRKYGSYSMVRPLDLQHYLEEDVSKRALVWHENVLCVNVGWMLAMGIMTKSNYGSLVQRGKLWRLRRGGNGRTALVALSSLPYKYKKRVIELVENVNRQTAGSGRAVWSGVMEPSS